MRYQRPKIKPRQTKAGSVWYGEWWIYQRQPDGAEKKQHTSRTFGFCATISKARAQKLLDDAAHEKTQALSEWTVARFVRDCYLPPRVLRWSRTTRQQALHDMDRHILPHLGAMLIGAVRKFDIERMVAGWAGLSHSTGRKLMYWASSIFEEAFDNDLIAKNPCRKVRLPEMRKWQQTKAYSAEETRLLCTQTGQLGLMLRILLLCGLRPGELIALRRNDVQGGRLVVDESSDGGRRYKDTKTHRERIILMAPGLARQLADHIGTSPGAGEDPVFLNSEGHMHTPSGLYGWLREHVSGLVQGWQPKRCRTTFTTHLDADLGDRQAMLGHSTPEMTRRHYLGSDDARISEAMADLERRMVRERVQ